jgi:hypothetical protein
MPPGSITNADETQGYLSGAAARNQGVPCTPIPPRVAAALPQSGGHQERVLSSCYALSLSTAGLHSPRCIFRHVTAFRMRSAVKLHSASYPGIRSSGPELAPRPDHGFEAVSRPHEPGPARTKNRAGGRPTDHQMCPKKFFFSFSQTEYILPPPAARDYIQKPHLNPHS